MRAHRDVVAATFRWNAAGMTWLTADPHTQLARLVEQHE
ncbi:hypothetical protein P3T27_005065 [Kitasatospora sp. MAA19]|nr:hypothetical protein [Kitasatospora sp. MAA19]